MYCKNCGAQVDDSVMDCPSCKASQGNKPSVLESEKTVAFAAYISTIGFLIALILHSNKKTTLGAYHLRQSLGLSITGIAVFILLLILSSASDSPLDGLILIVELALVAFWIIGLVNVYNGQMKPLPLFGEFYQKRFEKLFN